MDDLGTLTLRVDIPAKTIHAANMLLQDEYKDLVTDALREAKEELHRDKSELREKIKNELKGRLKYEILESLKNEVTKVAHRVDYNRFLKIDELADEIFGDMLNKLVDNYNKK